MTDALLEPAPVMRIGKGRTLHRERVLIEGGRVVIRTVCGLDPLPEGFTATYDIPTCSECAP